ncbi:MAG: NUDIX domain-containing protein, partial [Alphaproteobacteria bacterium]|nr:NUDIX domain-containing protein [Alphaproteobacteria bacterium]
VTVKDITPLAVELTSQTRGADYASAIMDLGATLCTPKNPRCEDCPWKSICQAHKENLTDIIPLIEKLKKQERKGNVFYIQNEKGEVFIQTRKGKGLLSGLTEFPWNEDESFPFEASFEKKGLVVHTFTHFRLELFVYQTTLKKGTKLPFDGKFVPVENFSDYPFSTLMKKVIKKASKKSTAF